MKKNFFVVLLETVLQNRPPEQVRALKKWILYVALAVTTFVLLVGGLFIWFVVSLFPSRDQLADIYSSTSQRARSIMAEFQNLPTPPLESCLSHLRAIRDEKNLVDLKKLTDLSAKTDADCTSLPPSWTKIKNQALDLCKTQPTKCAFAVSSLQTTTEFYLQTQSGELPLLDRIWMWLKSGVTLILRENPFLRRYVSPPPSTASQTETNEYSNMTLVQSH